MMTRSFNAFCQPKNSWELLHSQIYGLRSSQFLERPPLDLDSVYANAVTYSEDVFAVHSQDGQMSIPALSIGFANHPNFPHLFVIGDEEGVMYCRDTRLDSSSEEPLKSWKVSKNAIFAFKFVPEDPDAKILAATGDRTLILFDPHRGVEVGMFEGHAGSVRALDFQKDTLNSVFVSGARDGHILVWDIRAGFKNGVQTPVSFLANAHASMHAAPKLRPQSVRKTPKLRQNLTTQLTELQSKGSSSHSIPDLVFQDRNIFISTGTADGTIKFWDIRNISGKKPEAFHTVSLGTAFTSLCLDRSRTQLFATERGKNIYLLDAGPHKLPVPLARYSGASIGSFYIKCSLSADEEILGCGSVDGNGVLFKVKNPEAAPLMLVGHREEVMSVAFNHMDPYQFATNGDDNQVLLWRAEPFLDRSDKNRVVGEAKRDTRVIDRSQQRLVKAPSRKLADPSKQPCSQKSSGIQRSLTPPPQRSIISPTVLRTPNRGPSQPSRKRLKNMTLSPFMKQKNHPRAQ